MSLKDTTAWGSVRKVRFKSQIVDLARLAATHNKTHFSPQMMLDLIRSQRLRREVPRLKSLQYSTYRRAGRRPVDDPPYYSLVSEYLTFAKSLGLLHLEKGKIVANDESYRILELSESDPTKVDVELVRVVLSSKYRAYFKFLSLLSRIGGLLRIPGPMTGRTKGSGLKEFLRREGFFTDVASFYTIRDLFYDFNLVNWSYDLQTRDETIYMTCSLGKSSDSNFVKYCRINEETVSWWRNISLDDFQTRVMDTYLELTKRTFGKIIPIFELRDLVTSVLKLSDTQFNDLVVRLSEKEKSNITLSYGTLNPVVRKGDVSKGANLPILSKNRTGNFLRIWRPA